MRSTVSIMLLLVTVIWIVLSYIPNSLLSLPTLSIGDRLTTNSPFILGFILALFICIQLYLVGSTWKFFRRESSRQLAQEFNLRENKELFWTALPLFMTIILAIVIVLR